MERWMWARRTVVGLPGQLTDELVGGLPELLQAATGMPPTAPDGDGSVQLRLQAGPGDRRIHKLVRAKVGEREAGADWVSMPLEWSARAGADPFPSFTGRIEIEATSQVSVSIMLIGRYRPPLGPIGAFIDAALFNTTAARTAQWLVDRLAGALLERMNDADVPVQHPRGQITVRSVMTPNPITFTEDQPLRAAAEVLLAEGFSGAPVVDSQGRVTGVLSERDLLDKVAVPPPGLGRSARLAHDRHEGLVVGDICTRPARTTEADTMIRDAATEMATHDVDRLVVLDGGNHVGILTRRDVLRALARDLQEIEDAVREAIDGFSDADVEFLVRHGIVTLRGQMILRSIVDALIVRITEVDGVIHVDADQLRWLTDDITPPMPILG